MMLAATGSGVSSVLFSQLTAAAACAALLRSVQKAKWAGWVTEHTRVVNMILRAILAGTATIGITKVWSGTLLEGGQLTLTIPPLMVLLQGLWHWLGQYLLQHGFGSAAEGIEKLSGLDPQVLKGVILDEVKVLIQNSLQANQPAALGGPTLVSNPNPGAKVLPLHPISPGGKPEGD